ncbi:4446_t:CDS:2, partial [Gigaspora rosea]
GNVSVTSKDKNQTTKKGVLGSSKDEYDKGQEISISNQKIWWAEHLTNWNGQSLITNTPSVVIYTDAFQTGWGISRDEQLINGLWTNAEKKTCQTNQCC